MQELTNDVVLQLLKTIHRAVCLRFATRSEKRKRVEEQRTFFTMEDVGPAVPIQLSCCTFFQDVRGEPLRVG